MKLIETGLKHEDNNDFTNNNEFKGHKLDFTKGLKTHINLKTWV